MKMSESVDQKKILILEYIQTHREKHKKHLSESGFRCFIVPFSEKIYRMDFLSLFSMMSHEVKQTEANLILADTSLHVEIIKALRQLKDNNPDLKVIYLNYLGDKYKRNMKGIPYPRLRIEELQRRPEILSNLVQRLLR